MTIRRLAALACTLLLLGTGVGCARDTQGATGDSEEDDRSLPAVVDDALPGVVGLSTRRVVEEQPGPFPPFSPGPPFGPEGPPGRTVRGIGSGVLVDDQGTILTNFHVIQGADDIQVSLSERRDNFQATVVGADPPTDLAVLQLESPPEDLQPLPFGDSSALRLGEQVVAIGQPFGLSGTVTAGIVSAKGRQEVGLAEFEDFIQTDAAINPGNSGGALVNMDGEVIGISTAILSQTGGSQGIGFAIPSSIARSVLEQLLEEGEVQRGYLGVLVQTLSPELAEALGVPEGTQGVVVSNVQEESPAARAGLQRGDVIVEFRGREVTTAADLRLMVAQTAPGTEVEVAFLREGERRTVEIELGELGKMGGEIDGEQLGMLRGLQVAPIDPEARDEFNLPDQLDQGLVVRAVQRGSPAARLGLQPGDVLLEVNRNRLESVDQLTEAYREADEQILLLVYRGGETFFLPVPKTE